jgi:type VI secretion system protein
MVVSIMRPAGSRRRRRLALVLALALPVLTTGCSVGGLFGPSRVSISSVTLVEDPRGNNNSPVAVDLLMIDDATLAETIVKLNASDWFARREQFARDYPKALFVASWEVVPGQRIPEAEIGRKAIAVLVFANYATPGAHRARITDQKDLRIDLGEKDFAVGR